MTYLMLFLMFFRTGLFSFGGGLAMLPLIFQTVTEFDVMSSGDFSNLVALSQVTPGPIAVNAATYVGMTSSGIPGAAAATIGVSLPSFMIILIVMKFMDKYKESRLMQGVITGIRPAAVGLIASAAVYLAETTYTLDLDTTNIVLIVMTVLTILLSGKFKVSPIIITLIMGAAGAVICGQAA